MERNPAIVPCGGEVLGRECPDPDRIKEEIAEKLTEEAEMEPTCTAEKPPVAHDLAY